MNASLKNHTALMHQRNGKKKKPPETKTDESWMKCGSLVGLMHQIDFENNPNHFQLQ